MYVYVSSFLKLYFSQVTSSSFFPFNPGQGTQFKISVRTINGIRISPNLHPRPHPGMPVDALLWVLTDSPGLSLTNFPSISLLPMVGSPPSDPHQWRSQDFKVGGTPVTWPEGRLSTVGGRAPPQGGGVPPPRGYATDPTVVRRE